MYEYLVRVFGDYWAKVENLVRGVELEDGSAARFEDVVYAGGEGMSHALNGD